jgi:AcrR family transcriptional regulator
VTNTESLELRTAALQPRAQARVAAIREAALAHYNAVGRDKFNTAAVAEAAECSIGTIYRYWPNRIGLMDDIAPERDADSPVGEAEVVEVPVIQEVIPEDVAKRVASAEDTLKALRALSERLAEQGEGRGDLQKAGQAFMKVLTERGW